LREPGAALDRDVVIRFRPAGDGYAAAAFASREAGAPGALLLILTPRAVPEPAELLPRELLFVFDRSGSMGGESIAQARNALRACLRALNPGDSFNIFPFDNHVERFASAPLPFNQANLDAADRFIGGIDARGGTEIAGALRAALEQPRDPARLRVVVFLTDGAVANEGELIRELAGSLNEARVFAFGVGSAVNRFLLDKLAAVGRGSAEYILPGEPIGPAVQRFQRRASLPLVRDLAVDWGGAQVSDALPEPLPDLYAGQPLVLLARYHGARDQRVVATLRGQTVTGAFEEQLTVELPVATPDRGGVWAALPRLWARARLDALEDSVRLEPHRRAALAEEGRRLALEHGLLSPYTSFVAVEDPPPGVSRPRAEARVVVPVHLPAGSRREGFAPHAPSPLAAGVHYGVVPAPASTARGVSRKTGPGMVGGFLNSLRESLGGADHGGPQMRAPDAASYAPASQAGLFRDTAPASRTTSPAERRDAALRFLARTQQVDGSWAGDERATALALLAFAAAGHTSHAGDFRTQLGRAERWIAERNAPAATEERARAAMQSAGLTLEQLVAAQSVGGDADGAVLLPGADHLRPAPQTIALTAALSLLV
jgi:Ca-activated chloride channel family protein